MKDKNICKFVSPTAFKDFSVTCFVLETNIEVMAKSITLAQNRLLLVKEGEGEAHVGQKKIHFCSGMILFAFAGESFFVECKRGSYFYIDFSGARASELFSRFGVGDLTRDFTGYDGLIPLWNESLARAIDSNIDLVAESMLLYTFSRLSTFDAIINDAVNKIVRLSEENFSNPDLSLAVVAEQTGYNAKYISTLFKKKTGVGYSEYLRSLRIKYAISLFDHGIDSVKNVALLSGFSDPLYFSTVFKKEVGVSPKDYKKK